MNNPFIFIPRTECDIYTYKKIAAALGRGVLPRLEYLPPACLSLYHNAAIVG